MYYTVKLTLFFHLSFYKKKRYGSQSEVRNDTAKLLLDPIDTYPTRSLTVQSERSSERIPSISWSVHPTSPLSSKSPTGTLSHENMDGNAGFFMVEVKLLSDEEVPLQLEVTNDCLGRVLFNQVIERIGGIIEKDYFGLRYLDRSKQRQWLEMSKTVYKQLKYVSPRSLNFRVKHYPSDPVNEFRQEKSRGMSMSDAENKFLENAAKFETYGIEPLYVQNLFANHHTTDSIKRRHTLGFKCPTPESAEALWKWAVDRQCFFTLNRSVDAKESKANGGLFKRRQFYTFTSRSLLNLAKSVHDKRHSQSQNDLDRKYVDSNENLQDSSRMNRLIKGLDHHRSSLETRRNNNELDDLNDNLFMNKRLTDQFNGGIKQQLPLQTLPDQQQQQQRQHKSSLSTPNLINIPGIHKNPNEINNTVAEGDLLSDKKKSINELYPNKNDTINETINEKQRNNIKTEQMNITNMMNLIQSNIDNGNNDNIDSISSGVEANAEATEQPLQIDVNLNNMNGVGGGGGVNGFCTGSVNTLSSSPLKSADEDDDDDVNENDEFVNDALKQTNNSDMYQKMKVGNWLGANGIKSIKNTEDDTTPIPSINQKTDNNNNNNSETLNNLSNEQLNTKPYVSINSENIIKDDSYSPISTISILNPYSNHYEEAETKFIPTIKKPSMSLTTTHQIETNPIKSQYKQTIINPDNQYSIQSINDHSSIIETTKQSSMNRSKSLYFIQNKSITTTVMTTMTGTITTTTSLNSLTTTIPHKSQTLSYHRIENINPSKSSIYYPYACNITTIPNTINDTLPSSSSPLYSSNNYEIPLNIKSMKHYTESRKNIICYPKLSQSSSKDPLLSRNTSQHISRQFTLNKMKSIKDLSPQPRDWYHTIPNPIEDKTNYQNNINPDINNIILDPIDNNIKQIDDMDHIDTTLNKKESISNDLLYNNGYYPLSNKKLNYSNVTPMIHTHSNYYNKSDSMMAQTLSPFNQNVLDTSNHGSSLAKATKSINLNQNISSSISTSELINKTRSYHEPLHNSLKYNSIIDQSILPSSLSTSNSLAYLTQSSNRNLYQTSNPVIDSTSYYNQINNNNNLRKTTYTNTTTNTTNMNVNSSQMNRTAGSTAAYLAATGVGAYKLGDSLALLTNRTDHLIESTINNDNNNNDNMISKEYPKSESQTKTSSHYSIKQTSSYTPSIPPKPSYIQSINNQSRIINQSREKNNTTTTTTATTTMTTITTTDNNVNDAEEEKISSRTFSRRLAPLYRSYYKISLVPSHVKTS
uniref:FERM domain-containing protein 5 n=1 Tax=Schistosoma haematobium TaxID=6185 RepID=A0A095AYK3_SCHHA